LGSIRRTPFVSSITHSDAFRANVLQDFTLAYCKEWAALRGRILRSDFRARSFPATPFATRLYSRPEQRPQARPENRRFIDLADRRQKDSPLSRVAIKMHASISP
jgi:hypothetical protein